MSFQLRTRLPWALLYLKQFKNINQPNILVFAKLRNQARNLTFDEFRVALRKVILMPVKTGIHTVL
jgi:hypothetical protein